MSNRRDIQFTYTPHNKATLLDCNFVVDSTNGNGLGIRSLKNSGRIASVFMHTTAPLAGSGNPNPQSGVIVVNLQDNYNRYLSGASGFVVPVSGTPISISGVGVLTIGNVYIITSLGSSTPANWHAVGVPNNITPAVGVSFIASVAGSGTGSGQVMAPAANGAGVFNIAVIGDPNLMNSNGANVLGAGNGMELILGCYKDSAADNPVLAAPADGTVIGLLFYMNNSAQGV